MLLINITQNQVSQRKCQSNYTVTPETSEKIQELAEFATTPMVSLESTNSWCAEDVSEKTPIKLVSTSTDEHPCMQTLLMSKRVVLTLALGNSWIFIL
jgi:hypothetical protein